MDSQVKERLVGAAVLVALGVWLIPSVLDGPESEPAEPESGSGLELPAAGEDAPVRTRTVELGRDAARGAVVSAPSSRTPTGAERPERPGREAASDTSARSSVQDSAQGSTQSGPARADAETTAAKADADTERADANAEIESGAAAERAPSAEAASATPAASGAQHGWMVQLGSFGEPANAERLVERASGYGYTAHVSVHSVGGRSLHRVRIAGYPSRDKAEEAIASLSAHGFVAQVVAPE